ncbi:agmatine deiminase family protein [Flammeovirgaceae bacterium SG7u.111]|nr:agmatine deiminase family protein [Flammeovirgaceae bacterium SG7u.132]WPO37094.1 agmatine deiminase family protein [Flammeovirgaceae bacterium SG7u.111]
MRTPRQLGYRFPAEWEKHEATWLSFPHNRESFPGKIDAIFPSYYQFIKELTRGEFVRINVTSEAMRRTAMAELEKINAPLDKIQFFHHPTNDAWCRDHGPAFVINPTAENPKAIVNWGHNAWGGKYPPFDLDNEIPMRVAEAFRFPMFEPKIIMEGGSVDFNGDGALLTTTSCLLNKNRNPQLSRFQIEKLLCDYYNVEQILWLGEGIVGDDTDGHIDDITRFVASDTVVTVVEHDKGDENYQPLQDNLALLKQMRLKKGKQLEIIELPMPDAVTYEGQRLPASYANFYIANASVIVPTFNCKQDEIALEILASCFKDRDVVGIDSTDIIWGLGSFHCLSQQEPAV